MKSVFKAYGSQWIVPNKERPRVTCYLGIGSNLEPRKKYLDQAVAALQKDPEINYVKASRWIETKPEGKTDQPLFLNGVIEIETQLPPVTLLQRLKAIEVQLGRVPREVWGPREIDLDILFYGQALVCEEDLTIPHPLLHRRLFVLKPMLDLNPDWIHPVLEKTIRELMEQFKND